jgi:hypothetical protein
MSAMKAIVFGMSAVVLAGCAGAGAPVGIVRPEFGNAVNQNIAAETVNPAAPNDKGPIAIDAKRAALQQNRYEADMVEKPADIGTGVQIGGEGGGGGNGGGAGAGAGAAR